MAKQTYYEVLGVEKNADLDSIKKAYRKEGNQLPLAVKFAAVLEIVWFSGLFGLLKTASRPESGGFVGDSINMGVLQMVDSAIAAIIYLVLIFITVLFITQTSPFTVFSIACGACEGVRKTQGKRRVRQGREPGKPAPGKHAPACPLPVRAPCGGDAVKPAVFSSSGQAHAAFHPLRSSHAVSHRDGGSVVADGGCAVALREQAVAVWLLPCVGAHGCGLIWRQNTELPVVIFR